MQDRGDVGVDGEKIAPIIILLYRLSRNKSQSINLIFSSSFFRRRAVDGSDDGMGSLSNFGHWMSSVAHNNLTGVLIH